MDILNGFKEIEGFPSYFINKEGVIVSKKTSLYFMRPYTAKNGYKFIKIIDKNGKTKHQSIHRLVAKTFIENPMNKKTVNHINGIRDDNRVENLEWATHSENVMHSHKVLGETPIRFFIECDLYHNDVFIKSFGTIKEASQYAKDKYGVSKSMLRKWHKNKNVRITVKQGVTTIP